MGVDSKTKIIHTVVATAANVSDVAMFPDLRHGEETRVWGDGAYQGQTEVMRECAPRARDFTQRRCRYKGQIVDEVAWAKNRTKSTGGARVSSDEVEVRIRESTLSRAEEERAPAVRYLCAGESVCEPQKTAGRSVGSPAFAPYARLQRRC